MDTSNIDYTQIIITVINNLFNNFFLTIDNGIYSTLDDITFIDSSIFDNGSILKLLGSSNTNSLILISLSLLFAFILYYGIKLLFSYYLSSDNSNLPNPLQFFIKAIFIAIFINFSFFICTKLIDLNSIISLAIRNVGEYYLNKNICFTELLSHLNSILKMPSSDFSIFSLDGILKSISSIGFFNLLFSYSLRFILIQVFTLISPFAILSLLLNNTAWVFRTWLKCFMSLLLLQSFISIILLVIFSLNFSNDIFSKIICIGSIYALIKSNNFIKEFFSGVTNDLTTNISNYTKFIRR